MSLRSADTPAAVSEGGPFPDRLIAQVENLTKRIHDYSNALGETANGLGAPASNRIEEPKVRPAAGRDLAAHIGEAHEALDRLGAIIQRFY